MAAREVEQCASGGGSGPRRVRASPEQALGPGSGPRAARLPDHHRPPSVPEQFAPSPEETALALEALMAVDTMLNRLGERPRQAFLMSQVYGMRYHEIGTALGVSERMIKKYMAQAMLHCLALDMSAAPAA
ncbi:hypothetical protein G6F57_020022 [Rhizopus arrhizus]|nr:hypothetical protein G6F57_020022 [Rhizopus arrhizus]